MHIYTLAVLLGTNIAKINLNLKLASISSSGFIISPQYLGELSLVDSDPFLKYLPSQTAAAAYALANNTVTGGSWVSENVELSCLNLCSGHVSFVSQIFVLDCYNHFHLNGELIFCVQTTKMTPVVSSPAKVLDRDDRLHPGRSDAMH